MVVAKEERVEGREREEIFIFISLESSHSSNKEMTGSYGLAEFYRWTAVILVIGSNTLYFLWLIVTFVLEKRNEMKFTQQLTEKAQARKKESIVVSGIRSSVVKSLKTDFDEGNGCCC